MVRIDRMFRRGSWAGTALLLTLSCNRDAQDSDPVSATPSSTTAALLGPIADVDGMEVTQEAFDEACLRLLVASEALRDVVDSLLVGRAAEERKWTVDEALGPAERRKLFLDQMTPVLPPDGIPVELLTTFYEQNPSLFEAAESWVIVETAESLDKPEHRIAWEDTAPADLIAALRKLSPGEQTLPYLREGMFRQATLMGYRPAVHQTFDEARAGIAREMSSVLRQAHHDQLLESLRKSATVRITRVPPCQKFTP